MEGHRFDRLVRDLYASASRRQVLRLVAGALAGLTLGESAPPPALAAPRATDGCAPGLYDCGGVCVNLETDPAHCGTCGHACAPGQVCCGSTLISPFGICADLMADPSNCGGCGVVCAANYACVNGGCLFFGCAAPLIACSGACVDTQSDPFNCGVCGSVCPSGLCQSGVCTVPFVCPPGLTDCGGFCADLMSDWQNCGWCGNACASASCQGGACVSLPACAPGLTDCGGGVCVDLTSDPANCAVCGNVCPSGVCQGGLCLVPSLCAPGLTDCGVAGCADLANDPAHCGACFNNCESGMCQSGICAIPPCDPGLTQCAGDCVELASDPANCGGCGNVCLGTICQGGVCTPCGTGFTFCGGVCVDLANDAANCGSCGSVCPSGACLGGSCGTPATPCNPPFAICHGVCVDLSSDPAHCGACDFGCGAGACENGICTVVVPICAPGLDNCGWFCVDVQSDPFNCGSCENVCLPGESCVAGVCTPPQDPAQLCPPPLTNCAGTCVDLASHTFHCGACFHDCAGVPPPGQSSIGQCLNGICRIICEPGYTDCGGTCVDLAANRLHCGGCGSVCPHDQNCVASQCVGGAAAPAPTPVPTAARAPARPREKGDAWALWSRGETRLRGAHVYQRRIDPDRDEPDALGGGTFGPRYTQDDFDALAALGANYVEISHPGLDAEAPPYDRDEAVEDNLDRLLDMAARADLFAVIGFRTGPGRNELGSFRPGPRRSPAPRLTGSDPAVALADLDDRVWLDNRAQDAWGKMWYETAERYRDHPIVIGYNLMVEPNANAVVPGSDDPAAFYPSFADTLADWNRLTPWLTRAVRDVDPETPILIEPLGYGAVAWLPYVKPTPDRRTVYRVNQYEPRRYVLSDAGPDDPRRLSYPGTFDLSLDGMAGAFDRTWLETLLQPIGAFAAEQAVPAAVAGFGALRWQTGVTGFVGDQMELFEQRGLNHGLWLWAPGGESWTEIDELSFRHGPDPDEHEPSESDLLGVIRADWQRNQIRLSSR